jgi:hypothetical protein
MQIRGDFAELFKDGLLARIIQIGGAKSNETVWASPGRPLLERIERSGDNSKPTVDPL